MEEKIHGEVDDTNDDPEGNWEHELENKYDEVTEVENNMPEDKLSQSRATEEVSTNWRLSSY